jgi:hypothetical protein
MCRLAILLILLFQLVACDNEELAKVTTPQKVAPTIDVVQLRELLEANDYGRAIPTYLALDLNGRPRLLFERGRALLEAAEFYEAIGEFAVELSSLKLSIWECSQDWKEMQSPALSCFLAIDSYERGEFARCLALHRQVESDGAGVELTDRARVVLAASYWRTGDRAQAEQLLGELEQQADAALALRIYRTRLELGTTQDEWQREWTFEQDADPGWANAALIDLIWLYLHRGEPDLALGALRRYDPAVPQVDEGSRQYYGVDFLSLQAQIYYSLAARDLDLAARGEGQIGLYSRFLLGRALRGGGEVEAGHKALAAFVVSADSTAAEDEYVAYLQDRARTERAGMMLGLGKEDEAREMWPEIATDGRLSSLALQAARAYEEMQVASIRHDTVKVDCYNMAPSGDQLADRLLGRGCLHLRVGEDYDLSKLEPVYSELISQRGDALDGADYQYYYDAVMQTARCFFGNSPLYYERASDLLEQLRDKSAGYDPHMIEPLFLVHYARANYRASKMQWSQSKGIMTTLLSIAPDIAPVVQNFSYVLASNCGPGHVTPSGN